MTWSDALASAGSTPAVWLAMGDSVTEGQGSSAQANRWTDLALASFRATAGVTGGPGFVPAHYRVYASDSPWGTSGIATAGTTSLTNTGAFGYRGRILGASGSQTWTVTGTAADIWWRRVSGGGTFTWRVGAGATTSVSTAGTAGWQRTTISLGASGSHTVTVARTAGTVTIGGIMVYDGDTAAGVHLYNGGSTSITSQQYVGSAAFDAGTPEYALMTSAVATIAPDLVSIELGLNDAGGSISASAVAANLTTIITDLQALATPPHIVLIAAYTPAPASGITTWSDYVTAIRGVATSTGATLLDLSAVMPTATTTGTGYYSTDGLHPNDAGNIQIATRFVNAARGITTGGTTGSYTWSEWSGGVEAELTLAGVIVAGALADAGIEIVVGDTVSDGGGGSTSPSGQAMPTGNVVSNGITWVPAVSQDFTTDAALGDVRDAYPNITFTDEAGGGGKYLADQTVTVAGSMLDVYVHHIGSVDAGAQMYFLQDINGDWAWTGGRFAVRFRADPSAGSYGGVFQLWPFSNIWAEGEMDAFEGDFGGNIGVNHHRVGANPEVNYLSVDTGETWDDWHTGVVEWVPGTSARYYLDGALVAQVTDGSQVATTEHWFAFQCGANDQSTNGADDTAAGHVQIDWCVIYQAA